jgi:hypothetical protein
MYSKQNILFLLLLFLSYFSYGQEGTATQSVRGTIVDKATKEPLVGINVELLNYVPIKMGKTNELGQFRIDEIPVGKHRLLIVDEKYETVIVPEVNVSAGHEVEINISLEEISEEITEVLVKARKIQKTTKDVPINHMALTGIRSFTIEEVKRFPGSLEDPSRLIAKFAGVSKTHAETGLVVRGHNAQSVLWRIEGLPVSSPNHLFFNEAATGYLPIVNIYLLRNSDFMHGIYPAEYGNAIGAVLDLGLRDGNYNKVEGSVKLALLSLEGFVEGPLNKKGTASFVAGGRYGWLSSLNGRIPGVLGSFPVTNDFSFKATINVKKDKIAVFGLGGVSSVKLDVSELDSNAAGARYLNDVQRYKTYVLGGVSYKKQLKKKGYIKTVLGSNYNREHMFAYDTTQTTNSIDSRTLHTTLSSYLHYSVNLKHQIRTGVTASHYYLDFKANNYNTNTTLRDFTGHTMNIQVHGQWLFNISSKIKLNLGVNGQYLFLNNTLGVSPRFAFSWQFLASHKLSLGYGWNHQMQPWEIYLNRSQEAGTLGEMADINLGFNQNHHVSLAYDWAIINNWRLKLEGYIQYMYNTPIKVDEPNISLYNLGSSDNLLAMTNFNNSGVARSYGVELTLEKFFSNGYYGLLTATYFDVKYLDKLGLWSNTESNNQFAGDLLIGKEFKIGKKKNNRFFIDLTYSFRMGSFYTPVNLSASQAANAQVLDWDNAYSLRHPHFHNVDLRFGIVINQKKKSVSHRLFFEAVNLLNQRVVFREAYNPYTRSLGYHAYSGLVPNLSYRLNFSFKKKR